MSAPAAPVLSVPESSGGGINASEASDGTTVAVNLAGTGAIAGDTLALNWGSQIILYTLTAKSPRYPLNGASLTVPAGSITAQGDGTFGVAAGLDGQRRQQQQPLVGAFRHGRPAESIGEHQHR